MNHRILETERLRIIAGTTELTRAAINDKSVFASLLEAEVPQNWPPEILKDAEEFTAETLAKDPSSAGWWIWYVVLRSSEATASDVLIGNVGLKGRPLPDGSVEVGYSMLEEFQRKGYATEATRALMDWAFQHPGVTHVIAETLPHLLPSICVMKKCGMVPAESGSEPEIIRYCKTRV